MAVSPTMRNDMIAKNCSMTIKVLVITFMQRKG